MGGYERGSMPVCCTGVVAAARTQGKRTQHGKPRRVTRDDQPDAREGQAGRRGGGEARSSAGSRVMPVEGRGLSSRQTQQAVRDREIGQPNNSETCSKAADGRCTQKRRQNPGYRFYALYDKISREDIPAHAYAQCRSNKGAPGADGQDFAGIEAYGVERWLAELALALREETYRPWSRSDACSYRRPTANSGRWASRPCGIGSA